MDSKMSEVRALRIRVEGCVLDRGLLHRGAKMVSHMAIALLNVRQRHDQWVGKSASRVCGRQQTITDSKHRGYPGGSR